jgi:hypothetical protein
MKKDLQYKYDNLFQAGIFPRLQNRQTLLQWACRSWQASKQEWSPNDQIEHENCENYSQLLQTYGPNYQGVKGKLGYIRGLVDDTD